MCADSRIFDAAPAHFITEYAISAENLTNPRDIFSVFWGLTDLSPFFRRKVTPKNLIFGMLNQQRKKEAPLGDVFAKLPPRFAALSRKATPKNLILGTPIQQRENGVPLDDVFAKLPPRFAAPARFAPQ